MNQKPKVAFVCVHNACRSQIAEALGKALAGDCLRVTPPERRQSPKSTQTPCV